MARYLVFYLQEFWLPDHNLLTKTKKKRVIEFYSTNVRNSFASNLFRQRLIKITKAINLLIYEFFSLLLIFVNIHMNSSSFWCMVKYEDFNFKITVYLSKITSSSISYWSKTVTVIRFSDENFEDSWSFSNLRLLKKPRREIIEIQKLIFGIAIGCSFIWVAKFFIQWYDRNLNFSDTKWNLSRITAWYKKHLYEVVILMSSRTEKYLKHVNTVNSNSERTRYLFVIPA